MSRWADDDDDIIPTTTRTPLGKDNTCIEVKYSIDAATGLRRETTTKLLITTVTKRQSHRVKARKERMTYFGVACAEQENVTIQSRDEMAIENPKNEDAEGPDGEDPSKALAGNLNAFWAKQQRRQLERKYDVTDGGDEEEAEGAPGAGGKYVPPSQRAGLSSAGGKSLASMEVSTDLRL